MEGTPPTSEQFFDEWARQTIALALMVRARDVGRGGVPTEYAGDAVEYAREVADELGSRVGPPARYKSETEWLAVLADAVFRWVQAYLED